MQQSPASSSSSGSRRPNLYSRSSSSSYGFGSGQISARASPQAKGVPVPAPAAPLPSRAVMAQASPSPTTDSFIAFRSYQYQNFLHKTHDQSASAVGSPSGSASSSLSSEAPVTPPPPALASVPSSPKASSSRVGRMHALVVSSPIDVTPASTPPTPGPAPQPATPPAAPNLALVRRTVALACIDNDNHVNPHGPPPVIDVAPPSQEYQRWTPSRMPPPAPKWVPPEGTQCQVCLDLSWEKVMEEPLLVMLLCPTHMEALRRAREEYERQS